MSMRKVFAGAFAGVLCFVLFPAGRAQLLTVQEMTPNLYVQVRMDTTGEATLNAWSQNGGAALAPLLPEVVHCQNGLKADVNGGNAIRCSRALRSEGLALEAVLDLAPIARDLNGSTGIELFVSHPRLGFESSSVVMTETGSGPRETGTARFAAGLVPAPIKIRFGYRPGQLGGVYLPLLALALALTLIATIMSRAGYAPLALSAILLSTMVWMGAAAQLQADAPLRILLFGTPLANFAALFVDLWPPLLCVATGVASGSRMRGGRVRRTFGEVFWAYAIVPLILTCAVGALPSMTQGNWFAAAGWLAAAPVFLLLRRAWNRARARSSTRQLTTGELKERVSALAARAGCPQVGVYISFSTHSQVANAFALPGRTIFLTAPLVRMLSKREVDAVAAHELSHVRHSNRGMWTALCFAMLLCETPAWEILYLVPGGLVAAMILPIAMFFAAMHGSRKREFGADANAAALTGDPCAMISSLARISRNNDSPLDMNAITEWFSSHPSTVRRVGALAAAARLEAAELETLCATDDPGEHYEIPAQEGGADLFTPTWQRTNAGIYGWLVIFGSCGAGLLVAWLLERFTGFGIVPILGGIVLGCVLTKGATTAAMSRSYGRLRRKLVAKLGVDGQIVGLAPDSEARIYGSYRFSDAGLLRFENGRLCYQSERIAVALNPSDVVEVGMVAAAPSNWFRPQPMVRFRDPESGQIHAFILHTLDWLATQRRLLRSIERWRATETSPESTSIKGFIPIAGQTFRNPTVAQAARGFLVTGGIALASAIVTCWILRSEWQYVAWVLVVTGCAYTSMLLPAMLYRQPSLLPEPPSPVETN
jgi:Zn-dependent protease with chaperone function